MTMTEQAQVEQKGASAWKWILGVGGGIALVLALSVYGSVAYIFAKGKPQAIAALDSVVSAEAPKLAPNDAALLREMNALAKPRQTSMACVILLANAASGALADHQVTPEEARALAQVRDFVRAENGEVSFKELGRFAGDNPEVGKLIENQRLAAQAATRHPAATTTHTQAR